MDTLIEELNLLWEPVRPFLARQIEELFGRQDGDILEIGPFSGLIFSIAQNNIGHNHSIAAFPEGAIPSLKQEAQRHGLAGQVKIFESDSSLTNVAESSVDLIVFRGALFFPALFKVDFKAIYRTLRTGAIAFVGGGFGKYTPDEVISRIGKRSEQLNAALGRVRITVESVLDQLRASGLEGEGKYEIITEGGLWVLMKKYETIKPNT